MNREDNNGLKDFLKAVLESDKFTHEEKVKISSIALASADSSKEKKESALLVDVSDEDELFEQAVEAVFEADSITATMLQRKFDIGYARASRLIDRLEQKGIISTFTKDEPRKALITKRQWLRLDDLPLSEEEIAGRVDHTLLSTTATWDQIKAICDDGIKFRTASVCIPASYVKQASEYVQGKVPVCTVIGFPNGYSTTAAKCFEAADAVKNGAGEIDMVINLGWVKDGKYDDILEEIKAVKQACDGKALKVIVETCQLTDEEKIKLCGIVSSSGADYIKTSTGFSTGGATLKDIKLFAEHKAPELKIKAAGGIKTLFDACSFINAGADRLGTSSVVKALKKITD